MNRWKNYGLWLSLASLLLIVLQTFGIDISPAKYEVVVNSILGLLVAFGVINNPSTYSRGFFDDKDSKK